VGIADAVSICGRIQRAVVPMNPIRESPRTSSPRRRHLGGDVVELVDHPPGPFHHHRPVVGEATALAIDEDDAQLPFQTGDVPADVGLHGVHRPRGRGERSVVSDGDQGGELSQVHLSE